MCQNSSNDGQPVFILLLFCFPERRQDGHGRGLSDGGHGALLRGAARGHEAAVDGRRGAGVLRQVQRVPAQRLRKVVSHLAFLLA